jgi:uncharacterized protein
MSEDQTYVPSYMIFVNGSRLSVEQEALVKKVTVIDKVNAISSFMIEFQDPDKELMDSDNFFLGSEVKIKMGFKDTLEEVINGEVTVCEANYAKNEDVSFIIRGRTKLSRLNRSICSKYFKEKSESDIINEIVKNYGMQCDIDSIGKTQKIFMQTNQTDWAFIMGMAERFDCQVSFKDSKMLFKKIESNKSEDVVLEWGKTLHRFKGSMDSEKLILEVKADGYNFDKQEKFDSTAKLADISTLKKMYDENIIKGAKASFVDSSVEDEKATEDLVKNYIARKCRDYATAEACCEGDPKIIAGSIVKVNEVTGRFSTKYIVRSVKHELDPESYVSYLDLSLYVPSQTSSNSSSSSSNQGTPVESSKQEKETESKNPAINNLKWKDKDKNNIEKTFIDDEVYMTADVTDIDDGKIVTITLREKDAPDDKFITKKTATIENGKIECKWTAIYFEQKDNEDYVFPEYVFVVEYIKDKITSDKSDGIKIYDKLNIQFFDEASKEGAGKIKYKIIKPTKEEIEGEADEEGKIQIDEIEPGYCKIILKLNEDN